MKRDNHNPAVLAKVKRVAAHLDSWDLYSLKLWAEDQANKKRQREHEAQAEERLAELAVAPRGTELMRDLHIALCSHNPQPGERVSLVKAHLGRKHRGIWVENQRLGTIWIRRRDLLDIVPYQSNERGERAAENERRAVGFARALNEVAAKAISGGAT